MLQPPSDGQLVEFSPSESPNRYSESTTNDRKSAPQTVPSSPPPYWFEYLPVNSYSIFFSYFVHRSDFSLVHFHR